MDLKYLKSIGIYILTAVISLAVIWYLIYQATGGYTVSVETTPAIPSSMRSTMTLDAYIMREETVLYADHTGVVNSLFADGEKIAIDTVVAQVYGDTTSTAGSRIMEINDRLSILEDSDISDSIILSSTATLDAEILELLNTIRYRLEVGDLDYALRRRNELLVDLNQRQVIVSAGTVSYGKEIDDLKAEKKALTRTLGASYTVRDVKTPVAGYYYADVDGYENIYSSAAIPFMTLDEFGSMIGSEPDDYLLHNTNGYGVCKIVTGYKWYIACQITREQLQYFGEGYFYDVVFPYSGDVQLEMELEKVLSQSEDERIVLFFSSGVIREDFNFLRHQTVEIVNAEYEGYRVPVSSVRVIGGRQGVYTLSGNVVSFKEITPLVEYNGYFIVEEQDISDPLYYNQLAMYDLIVIKGKGLYDGKIID